ncbi:MAG: class I SAM-dependent methyltransferase [Deltaproteobacteria bacterium]|nr:class I SAM-dependent methyltransferase [Deltaproteobacteria bacterium]
MPNWVLITLSVIGSLIFIKLLFVLSILSVYKITRGAMFHPSAFIRVKTFLDAVPMRESQTLVDIGCGDGRVLSEAKKRYGVRALGFEVNPLAYAMARIRTLRLKGVTVRCKNFWNVYIGDADVIFCYLFPDVMKRLAQKLENELKPGTRVVSCNFPLPGWKHLTVLYPDSSLNNSPIYCYRYPDSCHSF